jgi:hypothetical protein
MSKKEYSTRRVHLEHYADTIIEAAIKLGIERPAVIVILGDCVTGDVSTMSNLESRHELDLMNFVITQRLSGNYEVDELRASN